MFQTIFCWNYFFSYTYILGFSCMLLPAYGTVKSQWRPAQELTEFAIGWRGAGFEPVTPGLRYQ
jgi:hypothetical protein